MQMNRRELLACLTAACVLGDAARASALDGAGARAFIEEMGAELIEILRTARPGDERADEFLALFRRAAALPQIGRFTMGLNWRQMTEAQQKAFLEAFESHAVRSYTKSIGDYAGQTLVVTGVQDAGKRGMLVSTLLRAEGVSLAITQREEFSAMVEARQGDIDRFIADLRG